MLQRNTSGSALHVMTDPPVEVGPGELIEHPDLLTGFEAVDGAPNDYGPDESPQHEAGTVPVEAEAAVTEPVEPAPAEPVAEHVPAVDAAPVWPAAPQPGGITTV